MQLVMERVGKWPSTRIQETVPDLVDQVYQQMRGAGPEAGVVKCLEHTKRTPLDSISKELRSRGRIRTMVAISSKAEGRPTAYGLYCEWDDNQAPYQTKPRRRRREGNEG